MGTSKASANLDRLIERYGPRRDGKAAKTGESPLPPEGGEVSPGATDAPPSPAPGEPAPSVAKPQDPLVLGDALRAAITGAFPQGSQELALALALVEDGGAVGMAKATPSKVLDLVRALFPPADKPAPDEKQAKALREALAKALDDFEDLLDGLTVASAARASGGAARG